MKKQINEELNYIKYLFDYQKGKVVSEQVVTETTTIKPVDDIQNNSNKNPEENEDTEKQINQVTSEICAKNSKLCNSCIDMVKQLKYGKLKEKDVESCLNCKTKVGSEKLKCEKLKADLVVKSGQVATSTEKKGFSDKTSVWVMLGSGILSLFKEIKDMVTRPINGM
jgi:hypothetical protein